MLIKNYLSALYQKINAYSSVASVEEELIRRNFLVVFEGDEFCGILTHADLLRSPRKLVIDCLSKKKALDSSENILAAWTRMLETNSCAVPVFEKGRFAGVIEEKVIVDVLLKKIDQLNQQSLVSQQIKKEFINCLSHEIRTPLNGILGFMNILAEMDLSQIDESYKEYAEMITTNADSFLLMMNDLIDLSLKQSGEKLPLRQEMVSVEKIFNELDDIFQQKALMHKKHLTLVCKGPRPGSDLITDSEKLKHILYHLLDNALKFSTANTPIEYGIEKTTDSLVTFFVTSSGQPITSKDKHNIFDLFDRSGSGRFTTDGLGIGLTVAKNFVESLNGSINLVSTENANTFNVSIPRMIS